MIGKRTYGAGRIVGVAEVAVGVGVRRATIQVLDVSGTLAGAFGTILDHLGDARLAVSRVVADRAVIRLLYGYV